MKFLVTTAIAAALATSAIAYEANNAATGTKMEDTEMHSDQAKLIRTRDITGGTIYTMASEARQSWDSGWTYDEMSANLTDIGEIEDVVLSADGKMKGIVAEIGGFLDIGDKHVMLMMDDVRLVAVDDKSYAFVTRLSEEQLEEMESVDEGFWN